MGILTVEPKLAGSVLLIGAAIVILARHVVKLVLAARGSGR